MVTSRFPWFAIAAAVALFAGLLGSPYHSSERTLLAGPGLLYALDQAAPISRAFHLSLHLGALWLAAGLFGSLLPTRAARIALVLYAIHPLHTQTLASLEARPLLLAAVASLAALRLWRAGHIWPAVSCGILAALTDWSAAALPLLLWLWSSPDSRRVSAAPLGVLSGVALASIVEALGGALAVSFDYLAWQGVAMLRTLWLFMIPLGLSAGPEIRSAPLAAAAAWGALAAVAVLLLLHRRGPWRWFASAFIVLAPSTLLASPQLAADPRAAFALLFLCGGAGWLLSEADLRLLAPAAALFALATLFQIETWRSERSVWIEAVRLAPAMPEPRRRLAPLVEPGFALELLEQARRQAPGDPVLALELAETFARAGHPAGAEVEWERARRLSGCTPALSARMNRLTPAGQPPPCPISLAPSR